MNCPFCDYLQSEKKHYFENEWAIGFFDKYPVSPGHVLIIPKRHVKTYFETNGEERKAMDSLLQLVKEHLDVKYQPGGYNIGFNCGETAGQTVMHCHLHLIPRYSGDMNDPRGGVRGVIPEKQKY